MELKVATLLLWVFCVCMGERVVRVGNELKSSHSGVDQAGVRFLLSDIDFDEGTVFAYSAYFRNDAAVWFEIWRRQGNSDSYRLLAGTRHKPSLVDDREDIYIESKLIEKCIRVQQGDRLGVFFEEGPGSVAYTFDASSPRALGSTLKNVSHPNQVGDIIEFDRLTFPYDFSAAAHIDTATAPYANYSADEDFVDCPEGLLIPDYKSIRPNATTVAPPTGRPGDTGASGSQGMRGIQGNAGDMGATGAQGELGATGLQGPAGEDGINGAGATGARGDEGEKGDTGEKGPQGEKGLQGERGLPGPLATVPVFIGEGEAEAAQQSMFSSPMFSISAAIWLIVLTILMVVVLAVVITSNRRRAQKEKLDAESGNKKGPGLTPQPIERVNSMYAVGNQGVDNPAWMSTLKRETEAHVANTTIVEEEVEVSLDTQSENISENSENSESLRIPTYASNSYLHYEDSCNGSDAGLVHADNGSTISSEFSKPEMVY